MTVEQQLFTADGQTGRVIYRMRIYQAVPEHLGTFHAFFREHLLPTQRRQGARLVGRWETEDARVVAVWEYDDEAAYRRIEAAVRADPATEKARQVREQLPDFFTSRDEVLMHSTLPDAHREP
jgi:hypothetical protein